MVYIKSLDKQVWPGYIIPYKDELFSSWFFRLAKNHKIKTYSFSKEKLDGIPIWNRDIDVYYSEDIIFKLFQHTLLDKKEIKKLFLNSYEGFLFEEVNRVGRNKGILPLGIYHRHRKRKGLLFCPGCFNKGEKYYKKQWRLSTSISCVNCKQFLQESCPKCLRSIVFHRLDVFNKDRLNENEITQCYNCLFDLSKSPIYESDNKYIQYQKYIDKTLFQGYNDIVNYSFAYFSVIFRLCNLFISRSFTWNKFSSYFKEKYFNLDFEKINSYNEFDYLPIEIRRVLLYESYFLVNEFPHRMKNFIDNNNINFTDYWRGDNNRVPFWMFDLLKY